MEDESFPDVSLSVLNSDSSDTDKTSLSSSQTVQSPVFDLDPNSVKKNSIPDLFDKNFEDEEINKTSYLMPVLKKNGKKKKEDIFEKYRQLKRDRLIANHKEEFEIEIKKKIFLIEKYTGARYERYRELLGDWFSGEVEEEDFLKRIRGLLSAEELVLHNQLIQTLVGKAMNSLEDGERLIDIASVFYDSEMTKTMDHVPENEDWRPETGAFDWWDEGSMEKLRECFNTMTCSDNKDKDKDLKKQKKNSKLDKNKNNKNKQNKKLVKNSPKSARKRRRAIGSDEDDYEDPQSESLFASKSSPNEGIHSITNVSLDIPRVPTQNKASPNKDTAQSSKTVNFTKLMLQSMNQITEEVYETIPDDQTSTANDSLHPPAQIPPRKLECLPFTRLKSCNLHKNDIFDIGFRRGLYESTVSEYENKNCLSDLFDIESEFTSTNKSFCYKNISIPGIFKLNLRISDIATNLELSNVDNEVTKLCLISLRNLMKNLVSELAVYRTSYSVSKHRMRIKFGKQSSNLFSQTCQTFVSSNNFFKKLDESKVQKKLIFSAEENITMNGNLSYRNAPLSSLKIDDKQLPSCSLINLYYMLINNRSLIPIEEIWTKALHQTICATNNLKGD